jgi:hypothetical protein
LNAIEHYRQAIGRNAQSDQAYQDLPYKQRIDRKPADKRRDERKFDKIEHETIDRIVAFDSINDH